MCLAQQLHKSVYLGVSRVIDRSEVRKKCGDGIGIGREVGVKLLGEQRRAQPANRFRLATSKFLVLGLSGSFEIRQIIFLIRLKSDHRL